MPQPRNQPHPVHAALGDIISVHHHPQPRVRRFTARLVGIGLVTAGLAALAQVALAVLFGSTGVLFLGTAILTLILACPLAMLSALHPAITVGTNGLLVSPMLWRACFVPWSALARMEPHPLFWNNDATGRLLHGRRYRPREGALVLVHTDAGLPPQFRIVSLLTGGPALPAFAISSTTHTRYPELAGILRDQVGGAGKGIDATPPR